VFPWFVTLLVFPLQPEAGQAQSAASPAMAHRIGTVNNGKSNPALAMQEVGEGVNDWIMSQVGTTTTAEPSRSATPTPVSGGHPGPRVLMRSAATNVAGIRDAYDPSSGQQRGLTNTLAQTCSIPSGMDRTALPMTAPRTGRLPELAQGRALSLPGGPIKGDSLSTFSSFPNAEHSFFGELRDGTWGSLRPGRFSELAPEHHNWFNGQSRFLLQGNTGPRLDRTANENNTARQPKLGSPHGGPVALGCVIIPLITPTGRYGAPSPTPVFNGNSTLGIGTGRSDTAGGDTRAIATASGFWHTVEGVRQTLGATHANNGICPPGTASIPLGFTMPGQEITGKLTGNLAEVQSKLPWTPTITFGPAVLCVPIPGSSNSSSGNTPPTGGTPGGNSTSGASPSAPGGNSTPSTAPSAPQGTGGNNNTGSNPGNTNDKDNDKEKDNNKGKGDGKNSMTVDGEGGGPNCGAPHNGLRSNSDPVCPPDPELLRVSGLIRDPLSSPVGDFPPKLASRVGQDRFGQLPSLPRRVEFDSVHLIGRGLPTVGDGGGYPRDRSSPRTPGGGSGGSR
jgi:hypothetical protein